MPRGRWRRNQGKACLLTSGRPRSSWRCMAVDGRRLLVLPRAWRPSMLLSGVQAKRATSFNGWSICAVTCRLQRLVQFTIDTFGRLDILVSNAAVNPAAGPILTMDVSTLRAAGQPEGGLHAGYLLGWTPEGAPHWSNWNRGACDPAP